MVFSHGAVVSIYNLKGKVAFFDVFSIEFIGVRFF